MTPSRTLELGIVTDEIDTDIRTALRYAAQWKIRRLELRCVGAGRVPDISDGDARAVDEAVRSGAIVAALSPGLFKHPLMHADAIERELSETLPRTIALAQRFGARTIIVFGFQRRQDDDVSASGRVVEYLKRAAATAEEANVVIAIENEPGFWCDTGARTAGILGAVDSTHLRANWDPANALGIGEAPFPNGYEAIRPYIASVHVKDTIEGALVRCVPVGDGMIPWREQLKALLDDAVVSHVTIETHCLPFIEQSRKNIRTLRTYLETIEHTS